MDQICEHACRIGDTRIIEDMMIKIYKTHGRGIKNGKIVIQCFHTACKFGHVDIVKLIEKYVAVTDTSILYQAFIDVCSTYYDKNKNNYNDENNFEILETISNIYSRTHRTNTIKVNLMWLDGLKNACRSGHFEIVKFCVERNKYSIEIMGKCLLDAYKSGNKQTIFFIMTKGIDTGAHNFWNDGLYYASLYDHLDIAEYMIKNGANNFSLCMLNACWNGNIEMIKFMITGGATNFLQGLNYACSHSQFESAKFMVMNEKKRNGNVNIEHIEANMRYLCINGDVKIVELMLEHGATNLNQCLIDSINYQMAGISHLLIRKGANNFFCLRNSNNLLLYAMYCRYYKINNVNDFDIGESKYLRLLLKHPQYVLLVGSKARKISTSKLPTELFRLLFMYC